MSEPNNLRDLASKKMEPEAALLYQKGSLHGADAAALSYAISMKRIADTLDRIAFNLPHWLAR